MKKRVFLDTNIVIDYISDRGAFSLWAAKIFQLGEMGEIELCLSDLTIVNTAYFLRKHLGSEGMYDVLNMLHKSATITDMGGSAFEKALNLRGKDFEDAMQYFSARKHGADCIVTRNVKDFPPSDIPIMSSEEFLVSMGVRP